MPGTLAYAGHPIAGALDRLFVAFVHIEWLVVTAVVQGAIHTAGVLAARAIELLLGVSGLAFAIFGSDDLGAQTAFLVSWGAVALFYLVVGGVLARRLRLADPAVRPPREARSIGARRLGFLLTVAASLTGLGAALNVLDTPTEHEYGPTVRVLGVIVIVCAWILLHVGYARFYSHWTQWRFPACAQPGIIEFLYFSFTVGVSFAASDVEVHSTALRWHVLVHSVISFFYNAIVLAVAISIIIGR